MKTIDQSTGEIRNALLALSANKVERVAVTPKELEQPSSNTVDNIRRLMNEPKSPRSIAPASSPRFASSPHVNYKDPVKIDAIFACLAICADEERRALAFGSREAVAVTQRCIFSIKQKFGIS